MDDRDGGRESRKSGLFVWFDNDEFVYFYFKVDLSKNYIGLVYS